MKIKLHIILILLCFTISKAQEQKWPKVMQFFEGRIVDVRYDNTVGFWYLDYSGKVIPEMTMNYNDKTTQYLYVDSTGKPISDQRYDDGFEFRGGVALVASPLRYVHTPPRTYAIINEKSEYLSPFSEEYKYTIGNGFYVVDKKTKQEVYDRLGKKVAECVGCAMVTNTDMKHIIMSPRYDHKDEPIIKILDFEGQELFSRRGEYISQISNDISTRLGTFSTLQPFYEFVYNRESGVKAMISSNGKVLMDSVGYWFFQRGKANIVKNKVACVVDTNFKILMPYSYGYDFYRELYGHPQGAYCARKNGTYMVIDATGKVLVTPTSPRQEIWYNAKNKNYEYRDAGDNVWLVAMNGDTIVSPYKYSVSSMDPVLPGYMVKDLKTNLTGYISENGKQLIPCEYDVLEYGGKNQFVFFKNDKAGYIDGQGKLLFYVDNALKLSGFAEGYALCAIKITDPSKASPSAQSVYSNEGNYQVQNKLIDSTGKFVSDESFDWLYLLKDGYAAVIQNNEMYMVDGKLKKIILKDNCQLMTYFYGGFAMAYDPKKNTWGLVNEKLEIVVPVIYDQLDTKEEERRYGYSVSSRYGYDSYPGFANYYANIKDGKLKVTLKGEEQIISVPGSK